jgi:hypothetical protein
MIMGKNKKQYIGAIEDEAEAAQIYDWHAIVTQGIRVSILSYSKKITLCIGEDKFLIHKRLVVANS